MDWPGLLKWSMKNSEGSKLVDKDIKPMSEEDAKWLEEALENLQFNEMKEIIKILDKLKQPELGTKEDEEERCLSIENLIILIDGLENNRSKNILNILYKFPSIIVHNNYIKNNYSL